MEFLLAASNSSPLPAPHTGWVILGVTVTILIGVGTLLFKGGSWYGQVNTDRAAFKKFMDEVHKDLKEIRDNVAEILGRTTPSPLARTTPLRLNDFGQKIAEQIGADEWASEICEQSKGKVHNKTPYEIQEFCFQSVQALELGPDQKTLVNTSAYENGLEVEVVLRVLAIVLRDKLLQHTNQQAP